MLKTDRGWEQSAMISTGDWDKNREIELPGVRQPEGRRNVGEVGKVSVYGMTFTFGVRKPLATPGASLGELG